MGVGAQVSLYNDAQAGQYLWLYWFNVFNDAEGTYQFVSFQGKQGTFLRQGGWITIGQGTTFGQVYGVDVPSAGVDFPTPGTQRGSLGAGGNEAGSDIPYRPPGPFAVIPPGFSFGVFNDYITGGTSAATFAITFYYSILPYIPDKRPV